MTPGQRIEEAIRDAAEEQGQGDAIADRIIAWFGELSKGNTNFRDRDAVRRFVEQLYDAIDVSTEQEE